ncbi:hypothetical protein M153_3070005691 [Pseudoloma neurophilia]|uniref:Uncharacterized protein n=1 Tax=Pseudoloma neurophilia TaxID=146866 RepID=A0A0R0M448_9MICR|nr:hypothetical protein M153_3070005691 [Pseudoloma neurophilia]
MPGLVTVHDKRQFIYKYSTKRICLKESPDVYHSCNNSRLKCNISKRKSNLHR